MQMMRDRGSRRWLLIGSGVALFVVAGVIGGLLAQRAQQKAEAPAAVASTSVDITPVVPLKDCPWGEALCILALGTERALEAGNVDAVIDFGHVVTYVCPGPVPDGPDEPYPLCNGALTGERREGYGVTERFAGSSVVDRPTYRFFIQSFLSAIRPEASDAIGTGALRVYAMSCSQKAFPIQNVSCGRAAIILSAIVDHGDGPQRELLIFWAIPGTTYALGFSGKGLVISEVWHSTIPSDEMPVFFQSGGTLPDLGIVDVVS
ncbi:MAG TPA: hypothetical protein VFY10_04220 [Dehalococcoidia bacterium]|nr:hypothetical protein [Dehalococcoidia bacterium]